MPKSCLKENCNYPRFGGGFCKYHQNLREDKPPKKIPPQSKKQKERLKIYMPIRNKYLEEHPKCEFEGCKMEAEDVHHKLHSRIGEALFDTEYFISLCREHHIFIHQNHEWAIKNGYLSSQEERGNYRKGNRG